MTSTRAEAAYLRSLAAFKTPTLDLLHRRHAPFIVAVLSVMFTAERPAVAVSDAHAELNEIIEELTAAGYAEDDRSFPSGAARDVCRSWVRMGWLIPQMEADVEAYRLSAHAVGALEITGRTGSGRTRVSNSRVRTLLDAVERLAGDAETDPARRLDRLKHERSALDEVIAELESGAVALVDDEELLEEAENILHLARELPADFTRVAESIKAMQRDVVADLRRDIRPTGEVLREYLQRGQHVMQSTPEGRAFAGALHLIGDPERIDSLTENLRGLLARTFAERMAREQRDELQAVARRIELGVQEVLTAQRRASHVITDQVRTHDPVRDRQVDELLRDVIAGLHTWTRSTSSDAAVEPVRSLPSVDLGNLRQSVSDLRLPGRPAPLTAEPDDVEFVDADTRAWGGPRYSELEAYVALLGDEFDLGDAFSGASEHTRRPVDLLGLLEIAHRRGIRERDAVSVVKALRPDGTSRRFAFGSVTARTHRENDRD
jgi:hypothetical protein